MFKDDIKYNYLELDGHKNIVAEYPKDRNPPEDTMFKPHPVLLEVFDKLMRQRPTWQFKAELPHNYQVVTNPYVLKCFDVYDGNEHLGDTAFWHDYTGKTDGHITFDNHRLQAKRERGGASYSSKVDVAAKRILKAFHTKTRKERGKDAFEKVKGAVAQSINTSAFEFNRKYRPLQDHLTAFLMDNWVEASKYLESKGITPVDETVPDLYRTMKNFEAFRTSVQDATGVTVQAEGNDYLVTREYSDDRKVEVMTNATLPDGIKAGLGMLKLLEPGSSIADIGMRVDQHTFFVLYKEKPNVSE